jgi:Cu/Ag efflux protein CusF
MRSWVAECLLAAAIAVTACGGGSDFGQGSGVVLGIDAGNAQITLEHGDIAGLMKAMTMTFEVADPKLLEGVAGLASL